MNRRNLLKWLGIGAVGATVCTSTSASGKEPEYTIGNYPYKEQVGDRVTLLVTSHQHCRSNSGWTRVLFTYPMKFQGTTEAERIALIRKYSELLISRALLEALWQEKLRSQEVFGGDVKGQIVHELQLGGLHCFVQTGPDEFREVVVNSEQFGSKVNGEGWSEDFNCYL